MMQVKEVLSVSTNKWKQERTLFKDLSRKDRNFQTIELQR